MGKCESAVLAEGEGGTLVHGVVLSKTSRVETI